MYHFINHPALVVHLFQETPIWLMSQPRFLTWSPHDLRLDSGKSRDRDSECPLFVGLMWAKIHLSPPKHKRNHKKKQLVVYGKYAPVKSHHPLATDLLSRSQIKKFTFFGYPKNMVMLVKLENLVAPWLWNFDPNQSPLYPLAERYVVNQLTIELSAEIMKHLTSIDGGDSPKDAPTSGRQIAKYLKKVLHPEIRCSILATIRISNYTRTKTIIKPYILMGYTTHLWWILQWINYYWLLYSKKSL